MSASASATRPQVQSEVEPPPSSIYSSPGVFPPMFSSMSRSIPSRANHAASSFGSLTLRPPGFRLRLLAVAAVAGCLPALPARADVKLPAIFGDHMVLQQETALPVWGWAEPGEKVTVTFNGKKAEATAGANGKWRAELPACAAGTPPGTLVVAGKNTLTITDVLAGDVWLCSGQSNMEFGLGHGPAAEATDSQIRLFHVPHQLAISPRDNVAASWQVCSPQTVAGFTAVGYYFAKNLKPVVNRPLGLIESSVGGTGAQEWTDLATLDADPALRHYADGFKKIAAHYPGGDPDYAAKTSEYEAAEKKWNDALKADAAYQTALKEWTDASSAARTTGQRVPAQPKPPIDPPVGPIGRRGDPVLLFNGMIAPLIPYPIKGVIWYQGENNAKSTAVAREYGILFPSMISGWRTLWKKGDFPFLFVQLANFQAGGGSDWPTLRESQVKALSLPRTGMAVTIDIGTGANIHPPDKADVGARLALAARHVAYGESLVYTGPIYEGIKPQGDGIRVSFKTDSIGGGLVIGTAPWTDPKAPPVSKTEPEGFVIAGEDRKWVDAQARIEGGGVVVSSVLVPRPVVVRYAWANDPRCNLYNQEGLPASPFRTDTWDESPAPAATAGAEPKR